MPRIGYLTWITSRAHALTKFWLALCFVPLLAGCGLIREWSDPTTVSIRGVPPTLGQLNIGATVYAQNQLVSDLIMASGLPPTPLPAIDPTWSLVTRAGIYEISRQ